MRCARRPKPERPPPEWPTTYRILARTQARAAAAAREAEQPHGMSLLASATTSGCSQSQRAVGSRKSLRWGSPTRGGPKAARPSPWMSESTRTFWWVWSTTQTWVSSAQMPTSADEPESGSTCSGSPCSVSTCTRSHSAVKSRPLATATPRSRRKQPGAMPREPIERRYEPSVPSTSSRWLERSPM